MKNVLLFFFWIVCSFDLFAQVDLENGLVGYFDFNSEGDTNVVNKATGTSIMPDGVILNGLEWIDGHSGKALLFNDATTGHVDFGTYDPSEGTDQLSVSVWINWNGTDGKWHSVCGKRDGWNADQIMWDICLDQNSGGIQFETNTTGGKIFIISPDPPAIGDWDHVVVVFDGSFAIMYVNGEEVASGEMTFGDGRGARFHIGAGTTGGIDPFNGAIDEFRIYNRMLNYDEVKALYNLATSVDRNPKAIMDFQLYQNFPNPFNPTTQIQYAIPKSGYVTIKVFNSLGEIVAILFDGFQQKGVHSTILNGDGLPSGIYMYQLTADNFVETKKTILLK